MDSVIVPPFCFITGEPTRSHSSSHNIEYFTKYAGHEFFFCFKPEHKNSTFVDDNIHIIRGLIINNKFPYDDLEPMFNNSKLERIIREAIIPVSPKEKIDSIILYLFSLQKVDGAKISVTNLDSLLPRFYFKIRDELLFYFNALKKLDLIDFSDVLIKGGRGITDITITFKGLEYIISLQENGINSNKCFIAMSFAKEMTETRDKIKEAVTNCGYVPVLVDEMNYPSEITINDAIIRYIKECKFLIADFSSQRHGVYFESGFALGLGKQVIYLCSEADFPQTHFDLNHYPHIVYNNHDEMKTALVNKIKAWID